MQCDFDRLECVPTHECDFNTHKIDFYTQSMILYYISMSFSDHVDSMVGKALTILEFIKKVSREVRDCSTIFQDAQMKCHFCIWNLSERVVFAMHCSVCITTELGAFKGGSFVLHYVV
jgi:hypothetical protein